jgi:hypothetical protein
MINGRQYKFFDMMKNSELQALTASDDTLDEVADLVQKKAGLGPELIKYIARTTITVWAGCCRRSNHPHRLNAG